MSGEISVTELLVGVGIGWFFYIVGVIVRVWLDLRKG